MTEDPEARKNDVITPSTLEGAMRLPFWNRKKGLYVENHQTISLLILSLPMVTTQEVSQGNNLDSSFRDSHYMTNWKPKGKDGCNPYSQPPRSQNRM